MIGKTASSWDHTIRNTLDRGDNIMAAEEIKNALCRKILAAIHPDTKKYIQELNSFSIRYCTRSKESRILPIKLQILISVMLEVSKINFTQDELHLLEESKGTEIYYNVFFDIIIDGNEDAIPFFNLGEFSLRTLQRAQKEVIESNHRYRDKVAKILRDQTDRSNKDANS